MTGGLDVAALRIIGRRATGGIAGLLEAYREHRRVRRDTLYLLAQSDEFLADIGLARGDILMAVAGRARL